MGFGVSGINAPGGGNEQGVLGFLGGLLGGLHNANQQREQEKQQKQEFQTNQAKEKQQMALTDVDMQQRQQAIKQSQVGQAQAQQQTALTRAFQDPSLAKDPMIVKAITEGNTAQGLPTKMKPDGTIDLTAYQKSITEIPQADINAIQERDPLHRKPLLDALVAQGYNIPKSMYTDSSYIDARTEAVLDRVKVMRQHEAATEKHFVTEDMIRGASEKYREKHAANMDAASAARQVTLDGVATARINSLNSTAKASLLRANAAVQDSNTRLTRFHANPTGGRGTLQASLSQVLKLHNELQKQLDTAQTAYSTLMNGDNPPDPGSDQAVEALQNITDLKTQIGALGDQYTTSVGALQSGADISARLSAASGKTVTNTSRSSGPKEGQRSLSKSGRPMIFRNGRWAYGD